MSATNEGSVSPENGAPLIPLGDPEQQYQPALSLEDASSELNEEVARRGLRARFALGMAAVSLAFQQSPGNELARGYVGLSALNTTGSPFVAGLAVGGATLLIEGATGAAAAHALREYSEKIHSFKDWFFGKAKRLRPSDSEKNSSPGADTALALMVGSAGVVARRHYHDKERTAREDHITVAKAAGGIALFSAGIGYATGALINWSEGTPFEGPVNTTIDAATDWRWGALALLGAGGVVLGKKLLSKEKNTLNIDAELSEAKIIDYDERGFVSLRIDDTASTLAQSALEFEQTIWDEKDYGSLDDYNELYLSDTRLFATFKDGKCIGTVRVFGGDENSLPAPFINDMAYDDEATREQLLEGYRTGKVEELATSAIMNSTQTRNVIRSLWRLAYRDAIDRGVTHWGIIMEPKRAQILNRMNGFTFEQKGAPIDYQGGMCAPHILSLSEVVENMKVKKPDLLRWFIEDKLGSSF